MNWLAKAGAFVGRLFGYAEIRVLAPLRRSRVNLAPKAPHHRRTRAVGEALAAAPPGLSYRRLIAHVRQTTGVGCSLRTVREWKKAQLKQAPNLPLAQTPPAQSPKP